MPATKRIAVVMQPVRTYCRGVLRGVASVSAQARWECVLMPADAPLPIGVLASTDGRALQVLAVCRKLDIAVPEAVALLGVDNDDVFCELASPPLSSIALSTQRIGYEAARMLELLMAGEKPAQKQL